MGELGGPEHDFLFGFIPVFVCQWEADSWLGWGVGNEMRSRNDGWWWCLKKIELAETKAAPKSSFNVCFEELSEVLPVTYGPLSDGLMSVRCLQAHSFTEH